MRSGDDRTHSRHLFLLFLAYGSVIAAIAFTFTRSVLLIPDGHMYMAMARGMRSASLEVQNGLDVVASPELWLTHSVQRGGHLYAKYPPLYGLLAVVPYALMGVRGLYAVNALALAASLPAFFLLARRLLSPARAVLATTLLPVGTPLVVYVLMPVPHLASVALILWSTVAWDAAMRAEDRRRVAVAGLACGALAGFAIGVRVQDVILAAPLFAGLVWARRRSALGFAVAGFLPCLAAISAINLQRFGSANPFSYGPAANVLGAAAEEETTAYFTRPSVLVIGAVAIAALLLARRTKSPARAAGILVVSGFTLAAAPFTRETFVDIVRALGSMLLNANVAGAGWATPYTSGGWMDKALLVGAPLLSLGLIQLGRCLVGRADALPTVLAAQVLLVLGFLSLRGSDPRDGMAVMGFFSLSPRYLVDAMPLLSLLAWQLLEGVRLSRRSMAIGAAAAVIAGVFLWIHGPTDQEPLKIGLLTNATVAVAAMLVIARGFAARPLAALALGPLVALANASAIACTVAEDGRALVGFARVEERWGKALLDAVPGRLAVVGWLYAKDTALHVTAVRDALVIVDASVNQAETLADTLDALTADGRTAVYYGWGLERCSARLAGRYRAVPLRTDPTIARLDRLPPPLHASLGTSQPSDDSLHLASSPSD